MSGPPDTSPLDDWLGQHGDDLVATRRWLHEHPELSGDEHETTRLLADRLAVAGLEPRVLSSGTGLLCDLGSGDGPVVAIRADIDGLAMDDEKDVAYRSRRPGVAHACGHDVHTTVLLGAALYLAAGRSGAGRVRLLFQPAEEALPGGALDVIADGGLDDVEAVIGLHCEPKLPVGTVGLRAGPMTSATDSFDISLAGPGGHTARPELTVDMVSVVGRIVTELPDAIRARIDRSAPVKVVFGAVHSGAAANVIPSQAELRAAVRTQSPEAWEQLPTVLPDALAELTDDPRLRCSLRHTRGVPPVVNDPEVVDVVRRVAGRAFGHESVLEVDQSWGGDDFAWYTQRVPGAYVRLGTHDPRRGAPTLDLHAGHFDVDERAIGAGVRLLVASVEGLQTRVR